MSERDLIDGLARLAGPVVPGEDPYGRLMRRHRRSRRAAVAGWSTGAVVAVVAALLGPIGIRGAALPVFGGASGAPSAPAEITPGQPLTPWFTRLLASPTHGSLAGDAGFLAQLRTVLAERTADYVPGGRVTVLFAGDVGEHRIIIAARHNSTHFVTMDIIDRVGASIDDIRTAATEGRQQGSMTVITDGSDPYVTGAIETWTAGGKRRAAAGVVPPGCLIEVTDAYRRPVVWRPATTGYVTSTDPDEWARITCDGTVRYQGPVDRGGVRVVTPHLSEADIDLALAHARGDVDRDHARQVLQRGEAERPAGPSRLLYMHRIGTGPQAEARYSVVATPMRDGAWSVYIGADEIGGVGQSTGLDIAAADTVLALETGWLERGEPAGETVRVGVPEQAQPSPFLVLAPRSATTVQVLDASGRVLETAALTDGVGTVHLTKPVRLRALDAAGAVLGSGHAPLPFLPPGSAATPALDHVSDWS